MGCGALGCEYLKGLALMGLAAMLAACATLNNWEKLGMESCAPKRKKVAFSSFSMPQEGTALTLMPGACSGPGGKLIVTDMDRIEAS